MDKDEYINLIVKLLKKLSVESLKRIYNYVNNIYVGRGD